MKAAELRQSILQAAVQGKLVPQNSQDEPASELLKRIQQKKAQLVKEGKLKKEASLPPIAEDEVPFDLPDGWVWCRLYDYCDVRDGTHDTPKYVQDGIPLVTSKNLKNGSVLFENVKYISPEDHASISLRSKVDNGDILFAMIGSIGNPAIVNCKIEFSIKNVALFKPYPSTDFNSKYLYHFLLLVQNEMRRISSGGVQSFVSLNFLRRYLIPIPPIKEQLKIVAKIDKLMALCVSLEAEEKKLDALEARFVEYLPKSILQAAVQGKLIPQNPYDEPASKLLKRIQREKAQLVKEGKLKKKKPLLPILEDEIPYDLPEGWVWCKFGEIALLISGRDLESSSYNDQQRGIPYITGASNLIGDDLDINRWTENPIVISQKGDILLSCKGTIGKTLFNSVGDCHIARQIMAIRPIFTHILPQYISIMLEASIEYFVEQARSIIPGISRKDILNLVVAVPPLAEQKRIVAKVDELMALCDELQVAYTARMPLNKPDNIIPLPAIKKREETLLAARGDVGQLSDEAIQAIDDLFTEDEE